MSAGEAANDIVTCDPPPWHKAVQEEIRRRADHGIIVPHVFNAVMRRNPRWPAAAVARYIEYILDTRSSL